MSAVAVLARGKETYSLSPFETWKSCIATRTKASLDRHVNYVCNILNFYCFTERPDTFPLNASSFGCSVKLSWQPPPRKGCPVTRYTIHYRESTLSGKGNTAWQTMNMKAHHSYQQRYQLWLECSQAYDFLVLGWNERGHSDIDKDSMVTVTTESGKHLLSLKKDKSLSILWTPQRNTSRPQDPV